MVVHVVMVSDIHPATRCAKRLVRDNSAGKTATMDRDFVNKTCRALPGATVSDPWGGGHDAWKVGGKMFASIGAVGTGVSVKTPDIETAELIRQMGHGEHAPYFHKSWVHIPWGLVDADEMAERLRNSYAIVRSGLTKKMQASLGPNDDQE